MTTSTITATRKGEPQHYVEKKKRLDLAGLGWAGMALLGCTGLAGPFWAGLGLLAWLGCLALGLQTEQNGASPRTLGRLDASVYLESTWNLPGARKGGWAGWAVVGWAQLGLMGLLG